MTQEEKKLLLKDLCARLPYGVMCEVSCSDPIDACVAMIEKLHELNLL